LSDLSVAAHARYYGHLAFKTDLHVIQTSVCLNIAQRIDVRYRGDGQMRDRRARFLGMNTSRPMCAMSAHPLPSSRLRTRTRFVGSTEFGKDAAPYISRSPMRSRWRRRSCGFRGTPPFAIVYAVPEFIWGM
jgi:hypothetical protein